MPQSPRSQRLPFSFLDVVALANDVVIVTEAHSGQIVYVNHAFSTLTRYAPDEALGQSPGQLLQGADTDPHTVTRIRRAVRDRVGIRTDILNYDRVGRPYWLDMNIVPLCDADGTVRHFAAIERDVTAHRQLNAQLQHLAATDELTGLPNRRSFNEALKREIAHARRSADPLTLIAFDLDHFKQVNDLHGHNAGDIVLRTVAERCVPLLRPRDLLARSGGEEFHVLLPGTRIEQAAMIAERLRTTIAALLIPVAPELIAITASFGVTAVFGDEIEAAGALKRADSLMYVAKGAGRNRVCREPAAAEPTERKLTVVNCPA